MVAGADGRKAVLDDFQSLELRRKRCVHNIYTQRIDKLRQKSAALFDKKSHEEKDFEKIEIAYLVIGLMLMVLQQIFGFLSDLQELGGVLLFLFIPGFVFLFKSAKSGRDEILFEIYALEAEWYEVELQAMGSEGCCSNEGVLS